MAHNHLLCLSKDGIHYKAGHIKTDAYDNIYGVLYKCYRLFDSIFEDNNGFVDLRSEHKAYPRNVDGKIYAKYGENGFVNIGVFKQEGNDSFFSLRRSEWLAKMLVVEKKPAISFLVKIRDEIVEDMKSKILSELMITEKDLSDFEVPDLSLEDLKRLKKKFLSHLKDSANKGCVLPKVL